MAEVWTDEAGPSLPGPGAVVVSSFPSAGLAAIVAGHYIVQSLKLPRVGLFRSEEIPPIAVVQGGRVNPAVRVYGRPGLSLILSEFPPLPSGVRVLANAILSGAERRGARAVIALEGVVPHPTSEEPDDSPAERVWAVTAGGDPGLSDRLRAAGANPLEEGVLGGVSGAMLVEAQHRPLAVAVLMVSAKATEGYPDHRAGAALIEVLDRLLPELAIDTKPLRTQAEVIEKALRAAIRQRDKGDHPSASPAEPTIYQ